MPYITLLPLPARGVVRGVILAGSMLLAASCSHSTTANSAVATITTEAGLQAARWGSNVTVSFESGYLRYRSNGLPNHARQSEYAVPNAGVRVPSAATAHAMIDPSRAQSYDFRIPTTPRKAASPTSTSLGTIGVMISGAALFNPYEGDGVTVAMAANFTVKNARGESVAFLDSCNGHPTPMGMYHYHAVPPCVTATVDVVGGPSHLIGVAFDGYPIYGDRDTAGRAISASELDACSGISSATPEYPQGIYHYVLLPTADATSSIRCFSGVVSLSNMPMMSMVHP